MKKILCFGDSNTYGYNPHNGQRLQKRWPNILKTIVENYEITEAGGNNRTAFCKDINGIAGINILQKYLIEQYNIIILAIGINDLQFQYNCDLNTFENGITKLVNNTKSLCPNAKIILISPSVLNENILTSHFNLLFDRTSIEKSYKIAPIYKRIAEENNCFYLNLNDIAEASQIDGLHYEQYEHEKIAYALSKLINNISI